ncbi:MAG: hypothetical protein AAF798_04670 [Bacteroidota bacterium]
MITSESVDNLVKAFQNKSLPEKAWTHEAHLTVGLWYLTHYTKDQATCHLRSGIITYNASLGGKNDHQSGYHETMTLFWIWLLDQYLQRHKGDLIALIEQFLKSKYSSARLPFLFYSKDYLMSTQGRAAWVKPNLQGLNFDLI